MSEKISKSVRIDIKEELKSIYPQVFEDNKINFEKLKSLLSGEIIENEDDRFYFNWAGKNNIYKLIQSPAYGTLKPDKEKSVDFDNTENIVIVGENLETLKLLLKPYFGKVKMIYIDPPYNTGNDFIYRDNFKEPLKDYLEKTGQIDSEGKKLTTNTEASGRYHSDWLNFMYPRLFLARQLLRDDGVIFVSIDDHEVHHLRMIMDEIFGEENFVVNAIWEKVKIRKNSAKWFSDSHDHILIFSKNKQQWNRNLLPRINTENYKNPDNDPRGPWIPIPIYANHKYDADYKITKPNGTVLSRPKNNYWRLSENNFNKYVQENRIWWGEGDSYPMIKKFLSEVQNGLVPRSIFYYDEFGGNPHGDAALKEIFNGVKVMENPKSVNLIKAFIQISSDKDDLVMDFFAGSGTTGHAVWDLNKEDGGNRKFILVQLDEEVQDQEIKKEFPTVADICIERLKRVSEKYKRENDASLFKSDQDFGFKVLKLDKSNFNLMDEFEIDKGENIDELKRKYLEWLGLFVNQPLVPGWKEIDVVYEVMLKEGFNLNSRIEKVKIKDDDFYHVRDEEQDLEFYISLKDNFASETIEEIRTSKYKGKMFVFLDMALTDSDKINLSAFVRLKVI